MEEEYEVVLSGMSGRFPNCDDVDELKQSLFDRINLVSNEGRWSANSMEVPHQIGTVKNAHTFDVTYFGIYIKTAEYMDPSAKKILECAVAAVHDAGLNMSDIAGSNTAAITSSSINETEFEISTSEKNLSVLMYANCMQANRISYFMDLKGPSYVCLSDWNGGFCVLKEARKLIANGHIKAAIVATSGYMFVPEVSYHFQRLGRLNDDGKTKCFSDDADGYSRSESTVVFFLQRKEDAIRNYGTLLGVESSPHGSKLSSCADCSELNPSVIKKLYEVTKIDPSTVAYLEAAGSASRVVDAEELNAVSDIFLTKRKDPLLIGSVKSNLGHTQSASVFVGLTKMLIAAESGIIPPNLHYSSPNKLVPALVSKRLKVVTEPTPLEGDLLALNNINGYGGLGHLLIKRNTKCKQRQCEVGVLPPDGLPRLVLLSGREEDALYKVIDKVQKMPIDEEFIALTHRTFGKGIKNHMFRGYTILHDGDISRKYQEVQVFQETRKPLWIIFSGMGSQWPSMGAKLMKYPTFAKSIEFCHNLLEPLGVDLLDTITNPRSDMFNDILKSFVGITAIQIGLVDILKEVGIEADGIIGHSVGEVGCAYYDGSLTMEQALIGSYLRGKVSKDSKLSGYLMASVGIGYKELKDMLPSGIDLACKNSSTNCTISGPAGEVEEFVNSLKEKGVFARTVQSSGIAYHSRYVKSIGEEFLFLFQKVVPNPKLRSPKWISSSVPEEEWDSDGAKYSSAEYHANNLMNPVLFEDSLLHIPKEAVVLEVAPRGLMKAIIQRALPDNKYLSLTAVGNEGDITLLSALGKLFNEGIHFEIEKLYPPIEFPVSRGTPSLSPLFTWLNYVFKEWKFINKTKSLLTTQEISLSEDKYSKLAGYKMKNVSIISASLYLDVVLDLFKKSLKRPVSRALVENITFGNLLKYTGDKPIYGSLLGASNWVFTLENKELARGRIEEYYPKAGTPYGTIKPAHLPKEILSSEEIYLCLFEMGLLVSKENRNIKCISIDDSITSACAEILWTEDLLFFFDAVFVFLTFFNSLKNNKLLYVKKIHQIFMDLDEMKLEKNQVLKVYFNSNIGLLWTNGFELHLPLMEEPVFECAITENADFMVPTFFSFADPKYKVKNISQLYEVCVKIILSNIALDNTKRRKLNVFLVSEDLTVEDTFLDILRKCNTKATVTTLSNDEALLSLEYTNMKNSYCFILSDKNHLDNIERVLEESQVGFLLCQSELVTPNVVCIFRKEVENKVYFLYKTIPKEEKSSSSVMLCSPKWESELKDELDRANDSIVYLVCFLSSVQLMHQVVKQCSLLENSDKIRFVFFGDHDMSIKFNLETYKNHLRKDLRINVFKNLQWGIYLFQPQELPPPPEIMPHNGLHLYNFGNIKADGIQLRTLGLNMADLTVNEMKLGVFEFSGTRDRRDVCGLATLNENTATLELDPIFMWDKPSEWTDEDITASLLAYAMAYYIVDLNNELLYINSILVHHGDMPLSQAVIQLALLRGYDVYITYDGEETKKESIRNLYPQVPENKLLEADQCLYENLMARTEGRGVQVAVNTSENERLLCPTAMPLNDNFLCKMFQISSNPTKPGVSIGLYSLFKNINFKSFGSNCLLNLPEEDKTCIWELVNNGLQSEMKPIRKTTISSSCCNADAISRMKSTNEPYKKFVVSMDPFKIIDKRKNLYCCEAEKFYFILGCENLIWYDLIQWLVSRGVKKIVIAANNISSLLQKRINVFLNENKYVQINLCPAEAFMNVDGMNLFNKFIQGSAQIGAVFAFGKDYCEGLNDLSTTHREIDIVYIGNCVKMNLHDIFSHWKKRLVINIPNDESDLSSVIANLDYLMNMSEPVLYLNEYLCINSDIQRAHLRHWEHFPISVSDVAYIASCSGSARWKEVRSHSPPHSHCKDVPPVFFLPPLKKGQCDKLISRLFYPVFEAVIPKHFKTFEELAQDLYKALEEFKTGVFTMICSDWSYQLGFTLGRLLEKNGKLVSLVLLGIDNSWADFGALKSLYSKNYENIENSDSKKSRELFEKGINILKHRTQLVCSSSIPTSPQFGGFCHVLLYEKPDKTTLNKLNEFCQRRIKVHSLSKTNYLDMLSSPEAAQLINSSVLVEHKDRARNINRGYDNFEEFSEEVAVF